MTTPNPTNPIIPSDAMTQSFTDGMTGMDATGIAFDGVDVALRVPQTELRLFGKPESFAKRRMGVALAFDADVELARTRAKQAAALVKPRAN